MIAGSVGLLVVAAVLLFVGIAKSSLAPLILSLLATLGAGGLLYGSFVYYRQKAISEGRITPEEASRVTPGYPAAYVASSGPAVPAAAPQVPFVVPQAYVPDGGASLPIEDWDELTAGDAAKVVETLNLDELHAVRRHEIEHQHRVTVLRAIDKRVDEVLAVRRSVTKS